jgi:hypothetical protein
VEALHDGQDPRSVRPRHASWLEFVGAMGDLGEGQRRLPPEAIDFLKAVEKTDMTRSFKMVVLRALLNRDALPGAIGLDELTEEFARVARRSAALRKDVAENLDDHARLRRYLEKNPVKAWVGGKGTGGRAYFALEGGKFQTTFGVPEELRGKFHDLVAELVEWRLAAYLSRGGADAGGSVDEGESEGA